MLEKALLLLAVEQRVLLEYGKHYPLYNAFCISKLPEFLKAFFLLPNFRNSIYILMNKRVTVLTVVTKLCITPNSMKFL